jgi:hypothetical protein
VDTEETPSEESAPSAPKPRELRGGTGGERGQLISMPDGGEKQE